VSGAGLAQRLRTRRAPAAFEFRITWKSLSCISRSRVSNAKADPTTAQSCVCRPPDTTLDRPCVGLASQASVALDVDELLEGVLELDQLLPRVFHHLIDVLIRTGISSSSCFECRYSMPFMASRKSSILKGARALVAHVSVECRLKARDLRFDSGSVSRSDRTFEKPPHDYGFGSLFFARATSHALLGTVSPE
jgi:hypothetical protein